MSLGADPDLSATIGPDIGQHRVGLDIALMGRFGGELSFHHNVRLAKTCLHITKEHLVITRHVRRFIGARFHPGGEHVLVQNRGVRLHRGLYIGDMREDLVVDLDKL